MATWPGLGTIILGDEAGVLTTERAGSWIPRMRAAAGDVPLELHFHNTTGMNSVNLLTGVAAGVSIVHTAVSSLANGPSMPSTEVTVDNLRRLGHTVAIDDSALPSIAAHFRRICEREGPLVGTPWQYPLAPAEKPAPRGRTGTRRSQ